MISLKKNVSVEVDAATVKKLGRARKALSQLAGAYIQISDEGTDEKGRTASR